MPFGWLLARAARAALAVSVAVLTVSSRAIGEQPPAPIPQPAGYVAVRAARPVVVDGSLDDEAWRAAPWTADFGDMASGSVPDASLRTRVKMLWDDRCLYIAADIAGPDLWAQMTAHDSPLYQENAFEF